MIQLDRKIFELCLVLPPSSPSPTFPFLSMTNYFVFHNFILNIYFYRYICFAGTQGCELKRNLPRLALPIQVLTSYHLEFLLHFLIPPLRKILQQLSKSVVLNTGWRNIILGKSQLKQQRTPPRHYTRKTMECQLLQHYLSIFMHTLMPNGNTHEIIFNTNVRP